MQLAEVQNSTMSSEALRKSYTERVPKFIFHLLSYDDSFPNDSFVSSALQFNVLNGKSDLLNLVESSVGPTV